MRLPCFAFAAACVLLLAPDTAAARQVDAAVRMQLDSARVLMNGEGFTMQGELRAGSLRADSETDITLELRAGHQYIIMGVCDTDCSDLDLVLYDAAGAVVDSDYELDDVPMVAAEPARDGRYRLKVQMVSCSIEPCHYGVAVFVKARDEARAPLAEPAHGQHAAVTQRTAARPGSDR